MAEICGAQGKTRFFTGYAYGDPMPHNATFATDIEDNEIELFVLCQREAGHSGFHLALGAGSWHNDERIKDKGDWR